MKEDEGATRRDRDARLTVLVGTVLLLFVSAILGAL